MIRIFIDQGHNPRNPNSGAEGNNLQEADLTYTIIRSSSGTYSHSSECMPEMYACMSVVGSQTCVWSTVHEVILLIAVSLHIDVPDVV